MISTLRNTIIKFIDSKQEYPVLAALSAGLYPMLYYYNQNYTLINSWSQFLYFFMMYLVIPAIAFYIIYKLVKKTGILHSNSIYVLPILNLCLFGGLIVMSTFGFQMKTLSIVFVGAFVLALILRSHLNKIIVFQCILSALVFVKLIPDFYRHLNYSTTWLEQPDDIESVVFKKKPNVYVIQPDGYANFSELKNKTYNFDNTIFESFLSEHNFKLYHGFRSNYNSTLSSNSSMFAMKHHFFNSPKPGSNEVYNSRDIIVGENPVVSAFKKNGYHTSLILDKSYILVNRPKIGYDYCNIDYSEVSFLARGFEVEKNVSTDLEAAILANPSIPNFYFVEKIKPGHIAVLDSDSKGVKAERSAYLKELQEANEWLKDIISRIESHDENALIIVVADHGGFVGLNHTLQSKEKQTQHDLVYSIFTSALAIKWPDQAPEFDHQFQSNVNLFRILFSYLSGNEGYLKHLQDDKSYTVIENGAPYGVYELINEKGEVVFNAFSK